MLWLQAGMESYLYSKYLFNHSDIVPHKYNWNGFHFNSIFRRPWQKWKSSKCMSSAHQREKKEESGGGREEQRGERKERWRKPWLQCKDGGKMMHSEDLGGVRTGRMNSRVMGTVGRQITCSRCAAVVMAWCVGRIFWDEENLCLSLPPQQNLPMSSSSYIHSRVEERKKSGR